jgi:hypothetical protein
VRQSRRARIRIHRRAMTDDEKSAVRSHDRKRRTPNAGRPTRNSSPAKRLETSGRPDC